MTTKTMTSLTRRARGLHPRGAQVQPLPGKKSSTLPEYLEAQEVQAVLAASPNPRARLLMLLQWRAGLRVSEALALQPADLSLDSDQPTIRVREGKGGRSRIVPVHPELQAALTAVLQFAGVPKGDGIIGVSRSTAWRWVQSAVDKAVELGALPAGRRVGDPHFPSLLRPPPAVYTASRSTTCPGGWATGPSALRWSTSSWCRTRRADWRRCHNNGRHTRECGLPTKILSHRPKWVRRGPKPPC